jgi:hypothetical protein
MMGPTLLSTCLILATLPPVPRTRETSLNSFQLRVEYHVWPEPDGNLHKIPANARNVATVTLDLARCGKWEIKEQEVSWREGKLNVRAMWVDSRTVLVIAVGYQTVHRDGWIIPREESGFSGVFAVRQGKCRYLKGERLLPVGLVNEGGFGVE